MPNNTNSKGLEEIADAVFGRNLDSLDHNGWDWLKGFLVPFALVKQQLPVIGNKDEEPEGGVYLAAGVEIIKLGVYVATAYKIYVHVVNRL